MATGLTCLAGYNYNREFPGQWFNQLDNYNNKISRFDRGRARQNLSVAGNWEIPIGKGRQFLANIPTVLDYVIGGWADRLVMMWHSGALMMFGQADVTGDTGSNVPAGYYFNSAVIRVPKPENLRTMSVV